MVSPGYSPCRRVIIFQEDPFKAPAMLTIRYRWEHSFPIVVRTKRPRDSPTITGFDVKGIIADDYSTQVAAYEFSFQEADGAWSMLHDETVLALDDHDQSTVQLNVKRRCIAGLTSTCHGSGSPLTISAATREEGNSPWDLGDDIVTAGMWVRDADLDASAQEGLVTPPPIPPATPPVTLLATCATDGADTSLVAQRLEWRGACVRAVVAALQEVSNDLSAQPTARPASRQGCGCSPCPRIADSPCSMRPSTAGSPVAFGKGVGKGAEWERHTEADAGDETRADAVCATRAKAVMEVAAEDSVEAEVVDTVGSVGDEGGEGSEERRAADVDEPRGKTADERASAGAAVDGVVPRALVWAKLQGFPWWPAKVRSMQPHIASSCHHAKMPPRPVATTPKLPPRCSPRARARAAHPSPACGRMRTSHAMTPRAYNLLCCRCAAYGGRECMCASTARTMSRPLRRQPSCRGGKASI